MFRVIMTSLGMMIGTFAIHAHTAPQELYMQESSGTAMNLSPQETKVIGNVFTCTMYIKCDTTCQDDATNNIHFTILNKGGSLNGVPVSKGDSMDVEIKTGDKLSIVAKPASRVELTNTGSTQIISMCQVTCK